MFVRIKATGQVEDFAPAFAQAALNSGRAELITPATTEPPTVVGVPTISAAMLQPPTCTAMRPAFDFQRGPRTPRRAHV